MNSLQQLQADLEHAARAGAQLAGESAVHAGVAHVDNAPRALANLESVHSQFSGPLAAEVTASQPAGVTHGGPYLPPVEGTADLMADAAAEAGLRAIGTGQ